jgi:hypothetical protein
MNRYRANQQPELTARGGVVTLQDHTTGVSAAHSIAVRDFPVSSARIGRSACSRAELTFGVGQRCSEINPAALGFSLGHFVTVDRLTQAVWVHQDCVSS